MATFKESLERVASAAQSNESTTQKDVISTSSSGAPIPKTSEENFQRYTGPIHYDWYEQYSDDKFSTVDDKKNVELHPEQINITQEENSQVIPFELNRYYDGVDLITMSFQIHYVNANNDDGYSNPVNVMVSENKIRFYWLVDAGATAHEGQISFEIIARGANEKGLKYQWQTRPNKKQLNVYECLRGNGIVKPSEDWYTVFVNQMTAMVSEAKKAAEEAQSHADSIDEQKIKDEVVALVDEKYYNSEEIDKLVSEINDAMSNLDSLGNLKVEYDGTTGLLSFKDGEDLLTSVTINNLGNLNVQYATTPDGKGKLTFLNGESVICSVEIGSINPSSEWTEAFKLSIKGDIDSAVKVVADDLAGYKLENDQAITDLTDRIGNIPEELKTDYYNKETIDSLLTKKANSSEISGLENKLQITQADVEAVELSVTELGNDMTELEEIVGSIDTSPHNEYDVDYIEDKFTFYENGAIKKQFTITGGGGGGETNSVITIERITPQDSVVLLGGSAIIEYNFSSVDNAGDPTGNGTATWRVGNVNVATSTAVQGNNSFDISKHLKTGNNTIRLTITDSFGTVNSKTWTITVIEFKLESTFNDTLFYTGDVTFRYTPYGSISKDVIFKIDGVEIGKVNTSISGRQMSYTLPAKEHGAHLLEVYMTAEINGSAIESNHIIKDIIWYDESSDIPVIGCSQREFTARQYDATNITYTVYDPSTDSPTVTLSVDGDIVSTLTLNSNTQIWQYRSTDVGDHVLTITCGVTTVTINAKITKLDIDVSPITTGLVFDFNPSGRSNDDEDRLWSYKDISMSVSDNFDWINGGYQIDASGDQYFCVKAGTRATISHLLFADDAKRSGKEFKLIFKTTNVEDANANFLSCIEGPENAKVGIEMNVHEAYIYAGSGSLYLPYSEEDIIEFEFNINKNTDGIPMIMGYEDGNATRPLIYTDTHNFTQTMPKQIEIGSDSCDVYIYRFKVYETDLDDTEILNNFIADARNAEEIISRYTRNQIYDENNQLTAEHLAEVCPQLRIIKIDAPHFTNNKSDKVTASTIEYIYKGGDPVLDNWVAYDSQHSGQGTTSNEYGAAGRNLDIIMNKSGVDGVKPRIVLGDGTETTKISLTRNSVEVAYLNIKVNIASSENQNNRLLQKRFNEFQPYKRPARVTDPKVKDTMEFYNCVVFIRENDPDLSTHREFQDTEWHYYALGNIGDSKKTDDTRLNDPDDPLECIVEIMDNTLPNSTFPGDEEGLANLEKDPFDESMTYGWRYSYDDEDPEVTRPCIEAWKEMYKFVVSSSDEDFKAKLGDYFVVDTALYHYLFTTMFTMIDNRAKNTFWHYGKCEDGKYRFDLCFDYDNDTGLGINNSGQLTMTYGYEDTDYKIKGDPTSGYAFNAALSTFFCRVRDLFKEELNEMYVRLESAGAWNAETIIQEFDTAQADFPEELWRVDIERKYLRPYREGSPRFLNEMMNGKKKYQRRQFMRNQEKYMATKFFGNVAVSDQIMFRCNTPTDGIVVKPNYTLHITPYADMYIDVMFGATYKTQVRAEAGKQYDIECPFTTMDDTAVLIYCSSMIQSMGDLSACYIHDNDFSKASKLKELIIGNATEGYVNSFLTNLGIGNNSLLETLDIQNTPNLNQSIDLSKCGNLKSLYAFGSGISGVTFADSGLIETAELPDVNALSMKNLIYLDDLDVSSFENLTTLVAENCNTIDLVEIVNSSPKLNRARLIGIDWRLENSSLVDRLYTMGGIDNNGYNTPISVLSGKVYFPIARQQMLDLYAKAWPDLEISYETLMPQFTATFKNYDGTILDVQYVDIGKDAVDPITRPDNPIAVPTRPSTVSTDFTYSGWDIGFTNIVSNLVITAQFTETVRKYTVKYVSGNYTLQEVKGAYGSYVSYTGDVPTDTSMESVYTYRLFKGWDKSGYVDGDKTINAVYDEFTYTDGCFDNMDTSTMTPVQLYAMVKVGKENDVVELKDTITIGMGNDYSYGDIEDNLAISEEVAFIGTNYVDSGIRLLEEDTDWTIAIDYKFGEGNKSGAVLVQCFQGDGSNGFKLGFSTYPRVTWGTTSLELAQVGKRDMLVLRHVKGESRIHVYRGNLPSDIVDYTTLSSNRSPIANSTLVFGCAKADDGTYENHAKGTIYWCKVWHADLGDESCKTLAMWTHEKVTLEAYGFKKYYLSDSSGQRSAVSFIATHLLANNMMLGNSTNNKGGWAESSLNLFLNNRFYNSLPYDWRRLIKEVKVPSTVGDKSHETSTSNCFISIPSVSELDASMNYEPYDAEGSPIPFILSEPDRVRKHADGTADEYFTRSPNIEYTTYFMYITKDGRSNGFGYAYAERGVLLEISI